MVDVVLINPPVDRNAGGRGEAFPMGLACIGSVLQESGFSVECIDLCVDVFSPSGLASYIVSKKPFVVGISVLSASLPYVRVIIDELREYGVGNIVVGGVHVTEDPDIVFHLKADYGFRGEGDYGFVDLVRGLVEKRKLGSMRGLVYEDEGKLIVKEKQITEAELIPSPARDLFDQRKYKHTTANISRGCPYRCSYCSLSCTNFRLRPLSDVLEEVRELVGNGVEKIDFVDDVFTIERGYVESFCDRVNEWGVNFHWACTTRANLIDDGMVKKMKGAGLWHISFGVETGSEERRKDVGKGITDEEVRRAFKLCRHRGIKTRAYGMIGFPGESLEEMKATVRFIKELKPHEFSIRLIDIVPGTVLYQQALKEDVIEESVWHGYMLGEVPYPVYIPKDVDFKDVEKVLFNLNKNF